MEPARPLFLLSIPVTFLSLFVFPWTVSVVGIFLSGLAFPPAAVVLGILADILYYPGFGAPRGVLFGCGLALLSYGVRSFVKARML